MNYVESAGIIIYRILNKEPEYLLLQYNAHHWDFPKGKMEPGETKEETAVRELQEETGLSAIVDYRFCEKFSYVFYDHDKSIAQKTVYFFIGQAINDKVTLSHEHIDFMWLPYQKAREELTYDNAKKVLKKAHHYFCSTSNIF